MLKPARPVWFLLWLLAISPPALFADEPAPAAGVFYVAALENVPWETKDLTEAEVKQTLQGFAHYRTPGQPWATIEGEGEVYFTLEQDHFGDRNEDAAPGANPMHQTPQGPRIAIRVKQPRDVSGTLYLPMSEPARVVKLSFRVPAKQFNANWREGFLLTQRAYYARLQSEQIAGSAWFRHQQRDALRQLGKRADDDRWNRFPQPRADMAHTYALVSGGRAVSENLQLDRELPAVELEKLEFVPIDEVEGVTIQEFDWTELVAGIDPRLDPLASLIPHDQHAVFFPRFSALTQFLDTAKLQGTPVLEAAELRSESAMSLERYQRQMCFALDDLDRVLGRALIKSVALTGGDPYFRTGTDVAVIFEATQPAALQAVFVARAKSAVEENPAVKAVDGRVGEVSYTGAVSPQRDISCYVATFGDAVIVTNSLYQLERLIAVREKKTTALAELDEYKFFRHRYAMDDSETALLILTDATIRRWTGPKWRIATSRRTRAAAVMSELLATHLDDVVAQKQEPRAVQAEHWVPGVREYQVTATGVHSETYGTLRFQQPIGEMDLTLVTQEEADLYRRWRDGYQQNWSNFFDPIAARLAIADGKVSMDLTVMPLIDGSDYNQMIRLSKGAKMKPLAGDPHAGALVHAALAINRDSEMLKSYDNMASRFANLNTSPLSWIGDTVAVYLDEDPFWGELAAAEDSDKFLQTNVHRLPLAVDIDVRSRLRLVAFLTAVRALIDQTAPGMTLWENKEHAGQQYVKVTPTREAVRDTDELKDVALYYAPGGSLLITLNEDLLKRSLERRQQRNEAQEEGKELPPTARPWLGENVNVQVDQKLLSLLLGAYGDQYRQQVQRRAWGNLPILNEWKRRFPDEDPVALHERVWGRRLLAPGGGSYEWDEEWQTMSSTLYGHPGAPKAGPGLPPALVNVVFANFGLTFEEHGLRSRVELHQK